MAFKSLFIFNFLAFKDGTLNAYADPTAGYTTGDAEAVAFLKAHPELAKKGNYIEFIILIIF